MIGALIATFGLTLLATNLGWTDLRSVMRQFWPFALVVLGIANLFNERQGGKFWGLVLIIAGLLDLRRPTGLDPRAVLGRVRPRPS